MGFDHWLIALSISSDALFFVIPASCATPSCRNFHNWRVVAGTALKIVSIMAAACPLEMPETGFFADGCELAVDNIHLLSRGAVVMPP